MSILTKEQIFAADDLAPVEVEVPQWGGSVRIRKLMASERAEIEREFTDKKPTDDPAGFRAALLMRTVIDDSGKRLFDQASDLAKLLAKSAEAVEHLFSAAAKANGFTTRDVEDLEKN